MKTENPIIGCIIQYRSFKIATNVPALGEVANFGTDYFLLKIKFLAKRKRELTTESAIARNGCYATSYIPNIIFHIAFQHHQDEKPFANPC